MQEEFLDLGLIGVTEKKKKQFLKKGIQNIYDLLLYLPRTYKEYHVSNSVGEGFSCFIMKMGSVTSGTGSSGIPYLCAKGFCDGKEISVLWFRQNYRYAEILSYQGTNVLVAGKASYDPQWKQFSICTPDVFTSSDERKKTIVIPVYSKIRGMADEYLTDCIYKASHNFIPVLASPLPAELMKRFGLLSYQEAIYRLHFPRTMNDVERAKRRLVIEDLYHFACLSNARKTAFLENVAFKTPKAEITEQIIHHLPYQLTPDQRNTLTSLFHYAETGKAIHAMIQGDVGCGKSIIAFLMGVKMAENGYQSAIMAPTSVLAEQHYKELLYLLEPYGITVEYIPSLSTLKKAERTTLLQRIKSGGSKILVGTHSLLSDKIEFSSLGLVITDEEHKFGVGQRAKLLAESNSGIHYITMSATPIPRSLAGVIFGESTQLYQITTMPPGRKPIQTAKSKNLNSCFRFLHRQIKAGRQAYVVCPQIEESNSALDIASVSQLLQIYQQEFGSDKVVALTGKNTKKELSEILQRFQDNQAAILIATTVIEVGVNVPNANTIIIHNAERFGLASLHQLRGRVGRGGGDAYCILFSSDSDNARLDAMCETASGFEIAEKDLQQRGAGDLFGVEQSGDNKYIDLILQYTAEYKEICKFIQGMQKREKVL